MTYCFRIRFHFSDRVRLELDCTEFALPVRDGTAEEVSIRSATRGETIQVASELHLVGRGYESETEARDAGNQWLARLQKVFAALHFGADFGDRDADERAPGTVKEHEGEVWLDDHFGVVVFACEPWPRFVRARALTWHSGVGAEQLTAMVCRANSRRAAMTDTERLAYDLYSASFTQPSADAQLVMRVMAVETLLASCYAIGEGARSRRPGH